MLMAKYKQKYIVLKKCIVLKNDEQKDSQKELQMIGTIVLNKQLLATGYH